MKPLALYDQRAPGVELTSEDVVLAKLSERFLIARTGLLKKTLRTPFSSF